MTSNNPASLGDFPEQSAAFSHSSLFAAPQIPGRSLVFVDTSLPDLDQLISGIKAVEVVLLDADRDGVAQVTAVLSQRQNLSSVHILSHGSAGQVNLGQTRLDKAALEAHADELAAWGRALTPAADILLYGCNVAAEPDAQFIQRLSQLTGADVAASTDLTGSAVLGGDWELEQTTGHIEADVAVDLSTQQSYSALLPSYNGREYILSAGNLTWEQAQAEARQLGGNLVTINDAAEETWLKQTFGGTEGFWIGLSDQRVEGQYEWASGEALIYTNWAPGEPNNWGGNEDFIMMNFGSTRRWNDEGASKRMRGIIELNPGTLPTYNGNQYRLLTSNLTWEQAQAEARQLGGNLVTINDAAEETWLKQTFGGNEGFWIGLSDQRVEGQYEWASGEALIYTNWAPGEPNNWGGNEDFIMMNFGNTRRWNDEGSGKRMRGVVEIANTTPLGSIALEQNVYSVGEGTGGVDIAIVRSGSSSGPAAVQYRADSGTATVGSDFGATEGTLSFAAGETRKIVRIPIQDDLIDEANESFTFVVQSPTGANLGTIRTATITIIDDDNALLTVNPVRANESSSEALITLTRGSGIGTASVDFVTQDGTALATSDYQSTTGTVNFAEGETSRTIRIAVTNDSLAEPNETFQVNFSNPVNLTLSSPSVTVTLVDDDPGQFVRETVISGLNGPTAFARTPAGGPALMFIAEKSGIVKVAESNSVAGTPFIDLSPEVNNVRDRGLLGIAVHPNFYSGSPYVYLAYTYDPPEAFQNTNPSTSLDDPDQFGNRPARVVRIKADAAAGYRRAVPTGDPDRHVVILGKNSTWANISRPDGNSTTNLNIPESGRTADGGFVEDYIKTDSESHTIGQLAFGADGALYVSIGDGTSYNAVDPRTISVLNPDSLSGKILRVDPLTGQGLSDNPFFNGNASANRSKVWNLGLRNPFRFTIQPGTSTPFIGDVGWNSWEEVNVGTRGANFGWPAYEGGNGTSNVQPQYDDLASIQGYLASNPSVTAPIYGRRHSEGARAIIMGDFYDGNTFSSVYSGALFVADVNEGTVDALTLDSQNRVTAVRRFDSGVQGLVYLETGPDGNLYFVNIGAGTIGRWRPLA